MSLGLFSTTEQMQSNLPFSRPFCIEHPRRRVLRTQKLRSRLLIIQPDKINVFPLKPGVGFKAWSVLEYGHAEYMGQSIAVHT